MKRASQVLYKSLAVVTALALGAGTSLLAQNNNNNEDQGAYAPAPQ